MTTLEQQIAHLRDYWKVPQEDIDKLMKLAIKDYELIRKQNLLYELVDETIWARPIGEEVW